MFFRVLFICILLISTTSCNNNRNNQNLNSEESEIPSPENLYSEAMINFDAQELELAIERIARWYKAFPEATVIIGNHDRMVMRKAQTSSIPSKWIKSYKNQMKGQH